MQSTLFPLLVILLAFSGFVNAGEGLSPLMTRMASENERVRWNNRKLVVIYYSNDVQPTYSSVLNHQIADAFSDKLEEACQGDVFSADEAARLRKIGQLIPVQYGALSLERDTTAGRLREAAQKKHFVLALASNRSAGVTVVNTSPRGRLFKKLLHWEHGPYIRQNSGGVSVNAQVEPVETPFDFIEPRFSYAPLNHPEVFRTILEDIRRVFPPNEYCYLLIVRSRGSSDSALTDVLTADVRKCKAIPLAKAVLKAIEGLNLEDASAEVVADSVNQVIIDELLTPELEKARERHEVVPNSSGYDREKGRECALQAMATYEFGTTKYELISTLLGSNVNGQETVFYPLVVLGAPRSRLEYSSDERFEKHLAEKPGTYEGFGFGHIGWLFAQGDDPVNIAEAIRKAAEDESLDFVGSLRRYLVADAE